jgi:hypothetical protein
MFIPLRDKAWMAGFFDGEGCITIRSTKKQPTPSSLLTVCNTKKESLKVFQFYFGGKILYRDLLNRRKQNKKPEYRWNCPKREDVEFIKTILPFLVIKRTQANLFLEFQKTRIRGSGNGNRLSKEELQIRKKIYGRMKILNKKGI